MNDKKKVLMVEDDPFLSSIIAVRLEKEGYQVTLANKGERVFELLAKEVPDLILLDIVMPGLSGFDVLKIVKADERYKHIPVIMFSNLGQDYESEDAKALGADDFLVKALFTPGEVMERIEAALKKKGNA